MPISANDTNRKSWLEVLENSDFPIQNIPFGVFLTKENVVTVGTRIGDFAIDLGALQQLNYFEGIELTDDMFMQDTLNDFISDGKKTWRLVRNRIADIFDSNNPKLRDTQKHRDIVIFDIVDVEMQLPVLIGDYTDFYSSVEHATNIGTMFRDPDNALLPNWKYLPVGYHGRASSIVVSGHNVHRPKGQVVLEPNSPPTFQASARVDFELEMAFIIGKNSSIGDSVSTNDANDYIFGKVLFNDWSARDIQKWEYVPLGPFLAKSFASSMSAWVVTLEALEPFKVDGPQQEPMVLPYLSYKGLRNYDINLEVAIQPESCKETIVSHSNFKYMYWNMSQQLAHHTVNGCNLNVGDLMASGTISGKNPNSYGSMLELSWAGTKPVELIEGGTRKFIKDNDTVIMRGYCQNGKIRVGFGNVISKLLKAK